MHLFARAVVTGFGLSLGTALFKKVSKHLGLFDEAAKDKETDKVREQEGATDPELQHAPSN